MSECVYSLQVFRQELHTLFHQKYLQCETKEEMGWIRSTHEMDEEFIMDLMQYTLAIPDRMGLESNGPATI
jgi:hypothetical protein